MGPISTAQDKKEIVDAVSYSIQSDKKQKYISPCIVLNTVQQSIFWSILSKFCKILQLKTIYHLYQEINISPYHLLIIQFNNMSMIRQETEIHVFFHVYTQRN